MMDLILHPALLRSIGGMIILLAFAHVLIACWRALVDARLAREHGELRIRQLMAQVESETVQRKLDAARATGAWNGMRKFRVSRIERLTPDVRSLYLVPHDGMSLPAYQAGQYLTLRLSAPGMDRSLVRCYSLSEAPARRQHYRITVKRIPAAEPGAPPGLVSGYLCDHLSEGEIVDVKAPSGSFTLDLGSHRPLVMIAGGIGITPIYSMISSLLEAGAQRELWLFYGVRNSEELCFGDELHALDAAHENFHLRICFDEPLASDAVKRSHDIDGRIDIDLLRACLPSANFTFYLCGPPPMMASVQQGLEAWGVPAEDIRTEAFGPASVRHLRRPAPPPEQALMVTFARSGVTARWNGADNLLEFAQEHGVPVESGCRAGGCGTCLTAVKQGDVDYTVAPDARPEAGSCLACIARPRTNLILDA